MEKYKKIDQNDIRYFRSCMTNGQILVGNEIGFDYGRDELASIHHLPEIVIIATSAQEISNIMRYANERHIPVTVRGSGTGLVGGCIPIYGGIVIDMSKMNHILEIDETNLTLTVEPGVLLMDIYSYVEPRGFFYAPDPGEKTATIGGNISTNAGGMRAIRYGTTRDWVMGLEVVLPDGSIEHLGGKVNKDSTGYSLKNLIIGSEGTLAIITKAILKLIPKPAESISLLVPFKDRVDAINAAPEILKAQINPTAIEYFERPTLQVYEKYTGKAFPDKSNDSYLLLTFEGSDKENLTHNYSKAAKLLVNDLNAVDVLLVDTDERKDSVWKARGSFLESIKASTTDLDECDVVVPKSEITDFIRFTLELQKKYNVRIPSFGHAGDGNLHIYVCRDDYSKEEFDIILKNVFDELYTRARNVGGKVSGEHGIGYAKKGFMEELVGKKQLEIMRGIKAAFDPNNILNPDKVVR